MWLAERNNWNDKWNHNWNGWSVLIGRATAKIRLDHVRKDDTQNCEAFLFALFFSRPTVFAYFDIFYQAPSQHLDKKKLGLFSES